MPEASNPIRKAVHFLVRVSQAFDHRFLPRSSRLIATKTLYTASIVPICSRAQRWSIEIGGGKNPLISLSRSAS
jgi:hypothetical protein